LAIDWKEFDLAMHWSGDGDTSKALSLLTKMLSDAETDTDRAAILAGQATCYSHISEVDKSLELIGQAAKLASGDRNLLLQIARCRASSYALKRNFEKACREFANLKSEFRDLLADDEDSAVEVDSRYACTLVDASRYNEAIPMFQKLFQRPALEDLQRLQLYFGIALANTGRHSNAQELLFEAAKGSDSVLSESALEHLSTLEQAQ
jgi:tetratricopeptide (TPR) repeat protein